MSDMGRRLRRRLGPEERRLWERVAATTDPLRPAPAIERPSTILVPPAEPRIESAEPKRQPRTPSAPRNAPNAFDPAPLRSSAPARPSATRVAWAAPEPEPVGRPEAGLDRRTAERLRKGAREPDARIDLHGLTAERAHRACLRFLAEASAHGDRVVLVITGKGRRDEHGHMTGRGILRDSLPGWLRASPLGHSVVGIYQAHRRHGGEGAFYVYLKRRR
ncbi:MAG TPA: Smr/MutS family protein [Paracoccaceae bacterium]|nr:Smr/MutS family protein [Paracoccaceae bacterium]